MLFEVLNDVVVKRWKDRVLVGWKSMVVCLF